MKFKSIIFAAAALAFAACAQNPNTVLKGNVDPELVSEVRVKVAEIDTVLNVTDGSFVMELPYDVMNIGYVQTMYGSYGFVSDGSEITIDFTEEPVQPKTSGKGVCAKYFAFQDSTKSFIDNYMAAAEKIQNDAELTDAEKEARSIEFYDNAFEGFLVYAKDKINENKDNVVSVLALNNIYSVLDPVELLDILESLDSELQEQEFVSSLMASVKAQAQTAEGQMFTDFEIEVEPGKTEKFSDYIGKGKYVLVDFWASWCGPCKREIPNLLNVYNKFHGENFDILSVAVWDEPQASIDTAKAYNIPWNHMVNAQQIPTDIYGIQGIPHIILFGPDGTIIKRDLRGEKIGEVVAEYVK